MNLNDFLEEENRGIIFCKIGKSSNKMWGKGGHFPYRDYIGKIINLSEGDITFERLDDVVKYLHYGDDLVIFSFSEGKNNLPQTGYWYNGLNERCYNTNNIYVKDVLSFNDPNTVNFIYEHLKDKSNFIAYRGGATSHLKDRGLFEAAQRWEDLVNSENSLSNKEDDEEKGKLKKLLDYMIRRLKKDNSKDKNR